MRERASLLAAVAVLTAFLSLPASAQTPPPPRNYTDAELKQAVEVTDADIRELEDTRDKIVKQGHVLLQQAAAVMLVERERVESLFLLLLLEGKMKPEQIQPAAARIGKMTRIYLTGILDPDLEQAKRRRDDLKVEVARRSAPPPSVPAVGSTA